MEGSPFPQTTIRPYSPRVAADDTSYAGESDARIFEPHRVVQKLGYTEELVGVLYIKPHAVIANKGCDLTLLACALDLDHGRVVGRE